MSAVAATGEARAQFASRIDDYAGERPSRRVMIILTDHLQALVRDLSSKLPELSHIDPRRVLVFARAGRSHASGAVASCHCVARPPSDPGYFFWERTETRVMVRRTAYVTIRSPRVTWNGVRVTHLVSIALPRFCDQDLGRLPKRVRYAGMEPWVAKLDTLVHELYHIEPRGMGLRCVSRCGRPDVHSPEFYSTVARLTREYLRTGPPDTLLACLRGNFRELEAQHDLVAGRVFSTYPAFPRDYWRPLAEQPREPLVPIQEFRTPRYVRFAVEDLRVRRFRHDATTVVLTDGAVAPLPVAA